MYSLEKWAGRSRPLHLLANRNGDSNMKLSQLLNKRVEADVIYDEQGLHIAFAPNRFDANIMALMNSSTGIDQIIQMLDAVMLDWDLTDDTGEGKEKKVPVTAEALRRLPTSLLTEISKVIMTEVIGAKNAGNSSDM